MTIELFLFLFTIGSLISSLLTEAIKSTCKTISSNVIALIDAIVVGLCGTCSAYLIMEISWTPTNVICIALMAFCIWIGSMVGYDKVMQTISQLKR